MTDARRVVHLKWWQTGNDYETAFYEVRSENDPLRAVYIYEDDKGFVAEVQDSTLHAGFQRWTKLAPVPRDSQEKLRELLVDIFGDYIEIRHNAPELVRWRLKASPVGRANPELL